MLIIADHSAKPGQGTTVGRSLHRIEAATVKSEVEAAGFKYVSEAVSGVTPKTRTISRRNRRPSRPTSSC